jgi:ketosteroid isomerase-like protein
MSTHRLHRIAQRFFAEVAAGELPDDLVTPELEAWTLSSGYADRARFQGGIAMLAEIVEGDLHYDILSLTAEADRVVAEVSSDWALVDGRRVQNRHVFIFRIDNDRIAGVAEYMDPAVPREVLGPLIQAKLAERAR